MAPKTKDETEVVASDTLAVLKATAEQAKVAQDAFQKARDERINQLKAEIDQYGAAIAAKETELKELGIGEEEPPKRKAGRPRKSNGGATHRDGTLVDAIIKRLSKVRKAQSVKDIAAGVIDDGYKTTSDPKSQTWYSVVASALRKGMENKTIARSGRGQYQAAGK